jgi:hypothetical protein
VTKVKNRVVSLGFRNPRHECGEKEKEERKKGKRGEELPARQVGSGGHSFPEKLSFLFYMQEYEGNKIAIRMFI